MNINGLFSELIKNFRYQDNSYCTSYTDFEVINVSNIFLCIFYQLLKYVGFMQDKMYLFVIRLRKNNVVIIDLFCLPIFFLKIK